MKRTELLFIRHAPVACDGRLFGRTDIAARIEDKERLSAKGQSLLPVNRVVASPAKRCRQTAETLFPTHPPAFDPRLWEQDFGTFEGRAFQELPNLGALAREELARHRPPGGESFLELVERVREAILPLVAEGGRIAVVAHAGTIRAALGLALGAPEQGLAFAIAPLSLTRLDWGRNGVAILAVNQTF